MATKTKSDAITQPARLQMSARMLDDDVGEISIYGMICYYNWDGRDTDSKAVRDALKAVKDATKLVVHISSPGGYLYEGMHMMHLIAEHGAVEKHAIVEGECCSAATLLLLPCTHISAYEGSEFMIHEPVGMTWGPHEEIGKFAAHLKKQTEEVAQLYSKKTDKPQDEIEAKMAEEFWMTAEEAVEYGFCDEVIPAVASPAMSALRMARGDLMMAARQFGYKHVPERLMMSPPEEAEEDHGSSAGGDAMNDKHDEREERTMTREELQSQHPELAQMLLEEGRLTGHAEGVAAERQRMQDLDEIAMPGCEQMIADAKYGEQPRSAADVSMEMIRQMRASGEQQRDKGKEFMDKRKGETDSMNGVRGQSARDNDPDGNDEQDIAMFVKQGNAALRRA